MNMKIFVRNIILSLVLLSFITATGGVHILVHYCGHAKKTNFKTFPELIREESGCCCSKESCQSLVKIENEPVFRKTSCCENNDLNLKLTNFELPGTFKIKSTTLPVSKTMMPRNVEQAFSGTINVRNKQPGWRDQNPGQLLRYLCLLRLSGDVDADPLS